jgi:hypothetical protein
MNLYLHGIGPYDDDRAQDQPYRSRGPPLTAFALTALKDPYFHSLDENLSSFAAPVTFPS